MSKRLEPIFVCVILVLGPAGVTLGADPNLAGLWRCDELLWHELG
jgi:hypothetical protein